MSKNKSVNPTQIDEMRQMVIEGKQPQKIADHFGIGISTVHNYKKQFKSEGIEFPSVKGRQAAEPKAIQTASQGAQQRNLGSGQPSLRNHTPGVVQPAAQTRNQPGAQANNQVTSHNDNTIWINGTPIHITDQAKSVNINKVNNSVTIEITL